MLKKILLMLVGNEESNKAEPYSHFKAEFVHDDGPNGTDEYMSMHIVDNGVASGNPYTLISGSDLKVQATDTQLAAVFGSNVNYPFMMTFPLASEQTGVCSVVNVASGKELYGVYMLENGLPYARFYFETFAEAFNYLNSGSTEPPTTDVGLLVSKEGESEFKVYLGSPTGENEISRIKIIVGEKTTGTQTGRGFNTDYYGSYEILGVENFGAIGTLTDVTTSTVTNFSFDADFTTDLGDTLIFKNETSGATVVAKRTYLTSNVYLYYCENSSLFDGIETGQECVISVSV